MDIIPVFVSRNYVSPKPDTLPPHARQSSKHRSHTREYSMYRSTRRGTKRVISFGLPSPSRSSQIDPYRTRTYVIYSTRIGTHPRALFSSLVILVTCTTERRIANENFEYFNTHVFKVRRIQARCSVSSVDALRRAGLRSCS